MGKMINVGDTVRLTAKAFRSRGTCPEGREDNDTAIVRNKMADIEGGLHMERDLHGCRYWNEADVKVVKRALTSKK